jgi:hypothetical protein
MDFDLYISSERCVKEVPMLSAANPTARPAPQVHVTPGAVLTRAMLRAAEILGLRARVLAQVIGVSEATLSRMKTGDVVLEPGTKTYELAALLVRMFRSLDAITGGEDKVTRSWMAGPNLALRGAPQDMITSVTGLVDVVSYLDAHRAVV